MAEMLVDGAKLDACNTAEADAIRAKTGGTDPIPYDFANNKGFADAIAAIPTGGGGALIASYTASEPVNAARIDFTSEMQDYDIYVFVCEGQCTATEWLCPAVNEEPTTSRYGASLRANTPFKYAILLWSSVPSSTTATLLRNDTIGVTVSKPFVYFKVSAYGSASKFTNFKISVYGVKYE